MAGLQSLWRFRVNPAQHLTVSNQMPVAVGLYLMIVAAFPASLLLERSTAQSLFREDGVVESLGALAFLIASIAFVVARFRLPAPAEARSWLVRYQVFHLVLAALMFLAFAEEISWGQRIFGWHSPDALAEINAQGETNIHNLKWLQTNDWTFWEAIFCLGFGIVLPLCVRFSAGVSAFWQRLGIPVLSLWLGLGFAVTFVMFHLTILDQPRWFVSGLDELKETFYAVVLAVIALAEARKRESVAAWPTGNV